MRTFCLWLVLSLGAMAVSAAAEGIPEGFTSIFNHANLAGWHVSMTNHHGATTEWRIVEGALTSRQRPAGNGGILLTDERYEDFEIYLEIRLDYGCDGGIFLRSNSNGQAYQVMLDYLEGGNIGGIHGERLEGVEARESKGWRDVPLGLGKGGQEARPVVVVAQEQPVGQLEFRQDLTQQGKGFGLAAVRQVAGKDAKRGIFVMAVDVLDAGLQARFRIDP